MYINKKKRQLPTASRVQTWVRTLRLTSVRNNPLWCQPREWVISILRMLKGRG